MAEESLTSALPGQNGRVFPTRPFSVPAWLVLGLVLGGDAPAAFASGHAISHYPSYYPDEIRIDVTDPFAAAKGLSAGALHAYVGAEPVFAGNIPVHVKPVASLRSFVVLTFDPSVAAFDSIERRCTAARAVAAAIRRKKVDDFVFHPYPVTPIHADYPHHADGVDKARADVARTPLTVTVPEIRAEGSLALSLAGGRPGDGSAPHAAILREAPVDVLAGEADAVPVGGWTPPWSRTGWFQAYRLLSPGLSGTARREADDLYGRLAAGERLNLAERIGLKRRLISVLTGECRRVVMGYVLRREYISEIAPTGIENVAFDSLAGLGASAFIRTAKLKDYPWNGQLRLGVPAVTDAAWNPVAGFSDAAGRLIWAAVGDPALIQSPFNADWMANRARFTVTSSRDQSGTIKVPDGVLRPKPGTGTLVPASARIFATAKVVYELQSSPYIDGTEPETADLLYPFVFAYRWGGAPDSAASIQEPRLRAAFASLQNRLVGFLPLRVERSTQTIAAGFHIPRSTSVIEVYLNDAPPDDSQAAALAAPWSAVPWHVTALMEEAVARGYAAFSRDEAKRQGVPWLDLVRDGDLRRRLSALIEDLERQRFRPDALKDLVTPADAERRWRALKVFGEKNGHFLVTNGPYRLKSWTPGSVTLQAVREASYPLGFGTFDQLVHPPYAIIEDMTRDSRGISIRAEAEIATKGEHGSWTERRPLTRTTARGTRGLAVAARYLLIGPDGAVVGAGPMAWRDDNRFRIEFPDRLPSGLYTAIASISLDGNALDPRVGLLRFEIGDK